MWTKKLEFIRPPPMKMAKKLASAENFFPKMAPSGFKAALVGGARIGRALTKSERSLGQTDGRTRRNELQDELFKLVATNERRSRSLALSLAHTQARAHVRRRRRYIHTRARGRKVKPSE